MVKCFYKLIIENKVPTLASSMAFNVILNGGSFLFLYLIFFNNNLVNDLISNLNDGDLKDLLLYFIDYQNNINYSFFLILSSIYSASSLYYHIINIIELLTKKTFIIKTSRRVISIILTIVFLIVTNIISLLVFELIRTANINGKIGVIILISLLIFLVLYFLNYISTKEYNIKRMYKGLLFSYVYILFFSGGFILYLNVFSNFKVIYGVLSFIFIFCFYIYFICIGILLGLCINIRKNKII